MLVCKKCTAFLAVLNVSVNVHNFFKRPVHNTFDSICNFFLLLLTVMYYNFTTVNTATTAAIIMIDIFSILNDTAAGRVAGSL